MLVTPHDGRWVTPFGHPRITARLTTPRGLSRPPTSFIGSRCQDIHHVPLHTYPQKKCSHPLCNTQHTTTPQPTNHHHTHPHHTATNTTRQQQGDCVRRPRPEAAPRKPHTGKTTQGKPHTGVLSGPNSVPSPPAHTRNHLNQQHHVFHPATPTTRHPTGDTLLDQAWKQ
jgi:hypothetical protein